MKKETSLAKHKKQNNAHKNGHKRLILTPSPI